MPNETSVLARSNASSFEVIYAAVVGIDRGGESWSAKLKVIPGTFWSRVLATFLKRLSAKNLISDKSVTRHIASAKSPRRLVAYLRVPSGTFIPNISKESVVGYQASKLEVLSGDSIS